VYGSCHLCCPVSPRLRPVWACLCVCVTQCVQCECVARECVCRCVCGCGCVCGGWGTMGAWACSVFVARYVGHNDCTFVRFCLSSNCTHIWCVGPPRPVTHSVSECTEQHGVGNPAPHVRRGYVCPSWKPVPAVSQGPCVSGERNRMSSCNVTQVIEACTLSALSLRHLTLEVGSGGQGRLHRKFVPSNPSSHLM
jgi:hypothetical protein